MAQQSDSPCGTLEVAKPGAGGGTPNQPGGGGNQPLPPGSGGAIAATLLESEAAVVLGAGAVGALIGVVSKDMMG